MPQLTATIAGRTYEAPVTNGFETVKHDGKDYILFNWNDAEAILIPYDRAMVATQPGMPPVLTVALSITDAITVCREGADFIVP